MNLPKNKLCGLALMFCIVAADAVNLADQPSFIYTAGFDADSWGGHVKGFPVTRDGVSAVAQWDAAQLIPPWQLRAIFTAGDDNRVTPFQWQHLDTVQQALLSSEQVLQYLRGNDALEVAHGKGQFRNRNSKLGDIMGSSPLYVGAADFAYHLIPESAGGAQYKAFVARKKQRRPMLYVGANDGMLHAFDALTGVEKMAFIPRAVFPYLHALSDVGYAHRSFVDGPLTAGDAYFSRAGKAAWRTILLVSTGAGAKSLFALDVSDPERFDSSSVLWQRSSDNDGFGAVDDDMGNLSGEALVMRLRHGGWAAVYGNGNHSKARRAALYLVDLAAGSVLTRIYGAKNDAALSNALSTPALEFNPRREAIAAYAGDLQGNLWKFDLDDVKPQNWQVAFDGKPLFVATDEREHKQSLAQAPLLARHPKGGKIIMFSGGTNQDAAGSDIRPMQETQSLYGIEEKIDGMIISGRAQLQRQTLRSTTDGRWLLSRNPIDWNRQRGWYVDLPKEVGHVVGKLQIADGVLWVLTFSAADQKSYLLALDYTIGGATLNAAHATFPRKTSMIEVVASKVTPTFIRLADGRRKFLIIDRNGVPQAIDLKPESRPPFRTWHQLPLPPGVVD